MDMGNQRRRLSVQAKRDIITAIDSGRKTYDQIEKEFGAPKYQIKRWRQRFSMAETTEGSAKVLSSARIKVPDSETLIDTRDRIIYQLKIKLADLVLENEKLKAQLHGKRYGDKELYFDNRSE